MNFLDTEPFILDIHKRPIYISVMRCPNIDQAIIKKGDYPFNLRFCRVVDFPADTQMPTFSRQVVYTDIYSRISIKTTDPPGTEKVFADSQGTKFQLPTYPYYAVLDFSGDKLLQQSIRPRLTINKDLANYIAEKTQIKNNLSETTEDVAEKIFNGDEYPLGENDLCFYKRTLCRKRITLLTTMVGDEPKKEVSYEKIANYCLVPIELEEHHYYDHTQTVLVLAAISPEFMQIYKIKIPSDDVESVAKTARKEYPMLYLNPDFKRADKYVSASVSIQMKSAPTTNIYHHSGWIKYVSGYDAKMNPIYAYGYVNDMIDPSSTITCESGKRLVYSQDITRCDSFYHAMRMLLLSENMAKTLPLFLFAHLGVMYRLFENAGFPPRFVLFLCGMTGSLKTSVSKVFFRILKDSANDIPANFNDTMTALEIKMGSTYDEVLLVDDFRPSALGTESLKLRGNLEKLIRYYGDGIGKGRGNIDLKLREEFKPHSVCAVTGEYIHGSASSLQRLLIINIDRKTYNPDLLKFYQDNPMYYLTHIRFFVDYLTEKYADVVNYIMVNFPVKRRNYEVSIRSKRLVDAAACLELTGEILLNFYANEKNLVCKTDIHTQLEVWKKVILDTVMDSDEQSRHMEPADMYCYALTQSIRNGRLKICDEKPDKELPADFCGFINRSRKTLSVHPVTAYTEVCRFWSDNGRSFVTSDKSVRQELLVCRYIRSQHEAGVEKTAQTVHIGNSQLRMLVFDLEKLEREYGEIQGIKEEKILN